MTKCLLKLHYCSLKAIKAPTSSAITLLMGKKLVNGYFSLKKIYGRRRGEVRTIVRMENEIKRNEYIFMCISKATIRIYN